MINDSTRTGKQPSGSNRGLASRPGSDVRSGSIMSSEITLKNKAPRTRSVSRHIATVDGKLVIVEEK